MKITSRASDYALLLLMQLGSQAPEEMSNVKRIAEELNISLRFLANIAGKLTISRIISSYRGNGGGIRMARPASEITVREVIEAIDGPLQTMFCQNTLEICSHQLSCQMKHFWDEIQDDVMAKLNTTTLADLLGPSHGKVTLPKRTTAYSAGIALPMA